MKTQTSVAFGLLCVRRPRNITHVESGKAKVHAQAFLIPTLQRHFTHTGTEHVLAICSQHSPQHSSAVASKMGRSPDGASLLNHRNNQSPIDGTPLKLAVIVPLCSFLIFFNLVSHVPVLYSLILFIRYTNKKGCLFELLPEVLVTEGLRTFPQYLSSLSSFSKINLYVNLQSHCVQPPLQLGVVM